MDCYICGSLKLTINQTCCLMQNKGPILIFTVLLTIATFYVLSFSWVSSNFEAKAKDYAMSQKDSLMTVGFQGVALDSAIGSEERKFLREHANDSIYPILGNTYEEVKKKELNLGLDLRGGMSVVLEVSIPDLIISLSDYNTDDDFRNAIATAKELQQESQADYVTLFEQSWKEQNNGKEIWRIFHNLDNKEKFPAKITDDEVFVILQEEAKIAINNTENIIRRRIDKFGVAQPVVQKQSFSGRILVELPGVDDRERVRKNLKATANLEFWETYNNAEVAGYLLEANNAFAQSRYPEVFVEKDSTATDTAVEEVVDAIDTAEEVIEPSDSSNVDDLFDLDTDETVEEESPETKLTKEEEQKKFALLRYIALNNQGKTPVLGYVLDTDTANVNAILRTDEVKNVLPSELRLLWGSKTEINSNFVALYAIRDYSLKKKPKLDGRSIVDASQDFDQFGEVTVSMNMDNEGAIKWAQMTREAAKANDAIAIVMDNLVYSAPTVNGEIPSGRSQITMGTGNIQNQLQEAKDLADLLKAGALPAPAKIVDESIVGPSLGKENIRSGMISFAVALLVVLLYMIFYYKGAGVVSDIALIANLIFLIGALASLGAALTLPGIAGIVLTIGMAVDANVLIYERIKEEMRLGKGLSLAVKDGYQRAYSAIIDANITTLLTAIVLFAFGTGPIRGFATTLIIGIFTSLFSAILITRLIFFNRLEKKKSISFYTSMTKDWFTNINFEFVKKRKIFYGISAVVIIIGVVSMFTKGFDQGVDFQGGRSYVIRFDDSPNLEQLRADLSVAFTENGTAGNPEVKVYGSSGQAVKITTPFMIKSENPKADSIVSSKLYEGLNKSGLSFKNEESQKVDPTISDDFRSGARNATIFALLIIFLYIFFRFKKWQFGVGALIAMIHDVLIVMSLFSIFSGIMPFTMEIDQAFIAAILTVIGYSINDTVVVFDRIREYLYEHKKDSTEVVINNALNSTLSRTINTSLSTFVVLLVIFVFGPSNIMGFVFALMAGIVVGTYSSIFIATPVVLDFSKSLRK